MNVLFGGAFKHHPQRLRIIVYSTFFIDVYSGDIYRVVTLHKVNKPHNFHNICVAFSNLFGWMFQRLDSCSGWRSGKFWKIWLLLMLKNGLAACLVGTLVAFIATVLSFMDYLPGIYKEPLRSTGADIPRPGRETP